MNCTVQNDLSDVLSIALVEQFLHFCWAAVERTRQYCYTPFSTFNESQSFASKFLPTTTGKTRKYPPSAVFGSYTCPWFWSFRDGRETTVTCCGQWATQHSKAHPTDPLQDLAWYRSTRRLCRAYVFCRGASVLFSLFALIGATRAILGALPSSRCLLKERETTMPLALYIRFLVGSVMKPRNGRAMNDQDARRWVVAVLRLV